MSIFSTVQNLFKIHSVLLLILHSYLIPGLRNNADAIRGLNLSSTKILENDDTLRERARTFRGYYQRESCNIT